MINAFQYVGMGVWNAEETYAFYKRLFGFKLKLNDITTSSKELEPVVGTRETMRMMMALNLKGGAVLEFVEHKSSPIRPFPEDASYGHYGILEIGFGVRGIERVVEDFKARGVRFLTPICELDMGDGRHWRYAYLADPDGLRVQLVEDIQAGEPAARKPEVQGVIHVGIGVSNLKRSKAFYETALGFDRLVYACEGHMPEMDPLTGNPLEMKLAILERSAPVTGPVTLLPAGTVKLFEVPRHQGMHIYKGRRWGDIGCMEFCMDVSDLKATVAEVQAKGAEVYLPPVDIDGGFGSKGKIAYILDPDGTMVEFLEVSTVYWVSAATFMRFCMPLLKLYDRLT